MSKKPRPPRPIESFGPEILQALVEGGKRPVEFKLPYRKAIHFRQRANQLRNQMRLAGHELYNVAAQAKISISWPEGTETTKSSRNIKFPKDPNTICNVSIAPADTEFADVLKQAGVEVPRLVDEPLIEKPKPDEVPKEGPSISDSFLSSYVKETP